MVIQPGSVFQRELLTEAECRGRLGGIDLARVVLSVKCLPAALPVIIELRDHHLLFASVEDAVVDAARHGDVIAVQADGMETDGATWSVLVTGVGHQPEPTDALADVDGPSPLSRALDNGATLVVLPLTVITGQRIRWNFRPPSG